MGENTLAVKVTADVASLQAQFAVAKAEVQALTSEMNKLAKQSASGILDPSGLAQLEDVSRHFLEAKAAAAELSAQMKETREASSGLGEGLAEIKAQIGAAFEVAGITAAFEAIKQVVEAVQEFGERAIQMRSMSEVLDVTTSQFQVMSVAAEEAGVSTETMARAGERLEVTLNEARGGIGAAVEKLLLLGVTTAQIADPHFKLNELLGVLHDRLLNTGTAEETRNELLKILGTRTAIAIAAIKEYDGSLAGVAKVMAAIHGQTDEEIKQLAESKAAYDRLWTSIKNVTGSYLAMAEAAKSGGGTDAASRLEALTGRETPKLPTEQSDSHGPGAQAAAAGAAARKAAQEQMALQREIQAQELENIKAGIEAYRQGSAERLAQVREYAEAAKQYYGSDEVDVVKKANEAVIAEQRARNETVARDHKKTLDDMSRYAEELDKRTTAEAIRTGEQLNAINLKQSKDREKQIDELANYAEQLDARVTQERIRTGAQLNAINAKETTDQLAQWQHMATSMQSSFSSAISGMVHGTETLGDAARNIVSSMVDDLIQMFVQMGVTWAEQALLGATVTKTTSTSNIAAHAAEAGAAGVASFAGAPWPIDIGAPEFGAEMALVAGSFAIAERGYDIPAGMNPMVQAHAREMILPAPLAEGVRNMVGQQQGAGGDRGPTHTIRAQNIGGGRAIIYHDELADAIKQLGHRFVFS